MKKEILIFNFLILLFFASSIVSISAFTFFQVLIILYALFLFLNDLLKKNNKKNNEQIIVLEESNSKLNEKKRINLFNIGYFFIIFGFILSFVFSTNIKLSIFRLPIYAIIILIIPSSYFLYKRFKNEMNKISNKILALNIAISFLVIIINFLIILRINSGFIGLFSKRQDGLLRNSIGFAYCMIIPVFYIVYNLYLLYKDENKKLFFTFLPIVLFSIFIQILLLISSGTRTAIFSFILSIIISAFLYIYSLYFKNNDKTIKKSEKSRVLSVLFIFIFIIFFLFIIYLFLPLTNIKSITILYEKIDNYLLNKKLYLFYRINSSSREILNLFYLFKNPKIIKTMSNEAGFRTAAILSSIKIIKLRPFQGTGPFAWKYFISKNKDLLIIFPPKTFLHSHCHNDILQILVEVGIIFFVGFLLLLFLSFKNILSKIKVEKKFTGILSLYIFFFFLLGGLTDFLFGHPLVGPYYGFFLGIFAFKE